MRILFKDGVAIEAVYEWEIRTTDVDIPSCNTTIHGPELHTGYQTEIVIGYDELSDLWDNVNLEVNGEG